MGEMLDIIKTPKITLTQETDNMGELELTTAPVSDLEDQLENLSFDAGTRMGTVLSQNAR